MLNSLPDTYTQLEYIESTGTQYIDTGVNADNKLKLDMDMEFTSKGISTYKNPFGAIYNTGALRLHINPNNASSVNIQTGPNNSNVPVFNGYPYTTRFQSIIDILNKTITTRIDDTTQESTLTYTNSFNLNMNFWLFRRNANSEDLKYYSYNKLYYFRMYQNGTLVRDFIPCYRNSDNEAGLYDLINNVFYTNQGTGKFIKGPSIINTNNTKTIDWSQSMSQRFEYYEVDPNTWKDKSLLEGIVSTNINKDSDSSTLETADIEIIDTLGECYIRVYLIATQGGVTEKIPFGTYLVQTPSSNFDGKVKNVSMTAYSPLIELKENPVPLGYTLLKNENIMENAYQIARTNCRAPVVQTSSDKVLTENFVANTEDTYIDYLSDLIAQAKYKFDLDELGQILFSPIQKFETLQPVYTFNDDNSSILLPEVTLKHDIYGIPNVVEVICTINNEIYTSVVKNEDPNSPTSIPNRGRIITHRVTDPDLHGLPTKEQVDEYAEQLLSSLSSVEYTINFSHGYYPLRLGDCVRLNYKKAELNNVKAKIISQSIKCGTGCTVSTTATFTKNLWR